LLLSRQPYHSKITVSAGACGSALVLAAVALVPATGRAQVLPLEPPHPLPTPLSSVPVPEPANLGAFIRDKAAAIRLGKAFYWDMQVGSDGIQACASCHFHAGADRRLKNQVNPGLNAGDQVFDGPGGPNHTLTLAEFPFHKVANPDERNSPVLSDRNDVVSSQGVFRHNFVDVRVRKAADKGTMVFDPVFHVMGVNGGDDDDEKDGKKHQVGLVNVRRVEPRNTPSVINAVFNFRNFWDGRAQNEFNGVNPFGDRDLNARVLRLDGTGTPKLVKVELENSSLASQACGPPLSPFESSFEGRNFAKLGRKVCSLKPLAKQYVHPKDSVLGIIARTGDDDESKGLKKSYIQLIQEAFQPVWWNSDWIVHCDAGGNVTGVRPRGGQRLLTADDYTMMEANFSLFWGLAMQLYEATLVSDDTPVDRFLAGNKNALTAQQQLGLDLFMNKGKCSGCHTGAELTNASVRNVQNQRLERMEMGDGSLAVYDNGFYNIGVRPTGDDIGIGGKDPFGNPLAESARARLGQFHDPNLTPPVGPNERIVVQGAHKACQLRNVELTAPYFHNGGMATLMQVVEFYNRGGDFPKVNQDMLHPDIEPLGLTAEEKAALVAFLKGLTDERVRYEKAPFDHPQIFVPNGHPGDEKFVKAAGSDDGGDGDSEDGDGGKNSEPGQARDSLLEIKAVGANGGPALKPTFPQ
jgi:cytochrome c peroxidase